MKNGKNKFNDVTQKIRDAIVFNEFEPGMPLGENMLAEKFQVSRTPIREAIKRLEGEHLVNVIPGRGAFVSEIRLKDIREIYDLRKILEPIAARSAMDRIKDSEIQDLRKKWLALAERVAAGEPVQWKEVSSLDRETHQLVISNAENERLREALGRLDAEATRLQQLSARTLSHIEDSIRQHLVLLDALAGRDKEKFAALLFDHIEKSESYILNGQVLG